MQPGIQKIKLFHGATDRIVFWMKDKTKVPIDLTGAIVSGTIKSAGKSVELNQGEEIEVIPTEGKISIFISREAKFGFSTKGTWSVKVTWPNGDIWRVLEGDVEIVAEK